MYLHTGKLTPNASSLYMAYKQLANTAIANVVFTFGRTKGRSSGRSGSPTADPRHSAGPLEETLER